MSAIDRIIAIRPEPGLSATVAAGRELGLDILPCPLSRIAPVDWSAPDAGLFDGVLIGSANAIRHGGEHLDRLRDLPVLAVGEATADAAREAGFRIEKTGEGGLQALLDRMGGGPRRLLRLSGEERIELVPPPDIVIESRTLYRVEHIPIPSHMISAFEGKPLVLLHSAKSAEHIAHECERLEIDRSAIMLAAIGPRVLSAVGEGWRAAKSADQPNDPSLLALACYMCH